jgi:hypothetical protein
MAEDVAADIGVGAAREHAKTKLLEGMRRKRRRTDRERVPDRPFRTSRWDGWVWVVRASSSVLYIREGKTPRSR